MPAGPYSYELIDPQYDANTNTFRSVNLSQLNDAGQVLGTLSGSSGGRPSRSFMQTAVSPCSQRPTHSPRAPRSSTTPAR